MPFSCIELKVFTRTLDYILVLAGGRSQVPRCARPNIFSGQVANHCRGCSGHAMAIAFKVRALDVVVYPASSSTAFKQPGIRPTSRQQQHDDHSSRHDHRSDSAERHMLESYFSPSLNRPLAGLPVLRYPDE